MQALQAPAGSKSLPLAVVGRLFEGELALALPKRLEACPEELDGAAGIGQGALEPVDLLLLFLQGLVELAELVLQEPVLLFKALQALFCGAISARM